MPEFWQEALNAINAILLGMPYHGPRLNERYLHHFFSHCIQAAGPNPLDLLGAIDLLRLHPEWPTYKEAAGIDFGKYRKVDGRYLPVDTGKKGGFVDFALGHYPTPEVGVEFKLLGGWQPEGVTFDYVKLLDRRNPFKAVASVVVLLRPNGLAAAGREDAISEAINSAYREALQRLGNGPFNPVADRLQRFIVTEIAPRERRHWFSGNLGDPFVQGGGVPPLPESHKKKSEVVAATPDQK
jgi:hypothetical protein